MSNEIASISKSIDILMVLKEEPYEFSAKEISDKTGINRSTVHRILTTLMLNDMVSKSNLDNKYRVGHQAFEIGHTYKRFLDPNLRIRNILKDLGKELKINVGYAIRNGMKVISVHEINEFSEVHFAYREGAEFSLVRGATGKTVMAFYQPQSDVEEHIRTIEIDKKTPYTPKSHDEVLQQYEEIRKNGYGISDGENVLGFMGVAVPVFNRSGEVTACVAVAYVKEGVDEKRQDFILDKVKDAAREIMALH